MTFILFCYIKVHINNIHLQMSTNNKEHKDKQPVTLGSKLQRLRRSKSLNRFQLASLADVNFNTLKSWEQNKRRPHPDKFLGIIKVFQNMGKPVDIEWFYTNNYDSYRNSPYISKHAIYEDKIFKLAYEKTLKKLDLQKNRFTIEEVNLEILSQYKKIFIGLSIENEEVK